MGVPIRSSESIGRRRCSDFFLFLSFCLLPLLLLFFAFLRLGNRPGVRGNRRWRRVFGLWLKLRHRDLTEMHRQALWRSILVLSRGIIQIDSFRPFLGLRIVKNVLMQLFLKSCFVPYSFRFLDNLEHFGDLVCTSR